MPWFQTTGAQRDAGQDTLYLGLATHKQAHVSVARDEQGRVVGTRSLAKSAEGWVGALTWARQQAPLRQWGIENSGSWGKGRAQFLLTHGEDDGREGRPQRTAQYRRRGRSQDKTDQTDALAIARVLLAEGEALPQVPLDDVSTELRLLSDHRDNLVVERPRLVNHLHAHMLQLDPEDKAKSGPLTALATVRTSRSPEPVRSYRRAGSWCINSLTSSCGWRRSWPQ